MKTVSLLNYTKEIAAAQIKKSEKIDARDIDEETPNKFVAYVDEGDQSYDVSITINSKKEITESSCDCENQNGFCVHKLSLIRNLASQKTKTVALKTVRQKKMSESDELLFNIDVNALRMWAATLFKKNKDLELMFINEFKINNQSYTVEDVKILISTTIKAVIKNRRNLDAALIKKTVDVLDSSLKSVMIAITSDIANTDVVLLLNQVFESIIAFEEDVYINSVKIQRFVEKLGNEFLATLHNVKDIEVWKNIVDQLFKVFLADEKEAYHMYSVDFIEQIYDKSSVSKERNAHFIENKITFYKKLQKERVNFGDQKLMTLLESCIENDVFEKYSSFFKPVKFANTYNEKLILLCIDAKKYTNAEMYCLQQIEGNSYETYDIQYYKLLKKIYELQDNEEKLLKTVARLMAMEYDFEYYLFLKNHKNFSTFNDLKKKLYANSSNIFRSNNFTAQIFILKMLLEEQEIERLKVQLHKLVSIDPILAIFNDLIVVGRHDLLLAISKVVTEHPWSIDKSKILVLQKTLISVYSLDELVAFKKRFYGIYPYKILEPIIEGKIQ